MFSVKLFGISWFENQPFLSLSHFSSSPSQPLRIAPGRLGTRQAFQSVVALSSAIIGISFSALELPFFFAADLGIFAGGCVGLINGILGSYFRLPIFIVTLGMLEISRGMTYMITTSQTVYVGPTIQWLSLPIPGLGISVSFVIALIVVVVAQLLLTRTVFGLSLIHI